MLSQVLEAIELLDSAFVTGDDVVRAVLAVRAVGAARAAGGEGLLDAGTVRVHGADRFTDFVRVTVPGTAGRRSGGKAPTLAIVGRLGGLGARPSRLGLVSDADGAIVAVACALKLRDMAGRGDRLPGDVVICTHICPNAPTKVVEGIEFMACPVELAALNECGMDPSADAVLSVDATKGNKVINHKGMAITPTVKEGYVLRVSPALIETCERVTGLPARVVPITTQDITPYGNGIYHINSIMQPAIVTDAPVVGVAVCSETRIPGNATGANSPVELEQAARFCIEVSKDFTAGTVSFYDQDEFAKLLGLYGSMKCLQGRARARAEEPCAPAKGGR